MIQERSILKVADNSGAKTVRVFRILGGTKHHYAQLGDIVIASVQIAEPRKAIQKKDKIRAVIVRQKNVFKRKDGSYVRFDDNAAVLIDAKNEPRSTRIFGPIPREVKEKGFEKIGTMAQEIV